MSLAESGGPQAEQDGGEHSVQWLELGSGSCTEPTAVVARVGARRAERIREEPTHYSLGLSAHTAVPFQLGNKSVSPLPGVWG